MARSLLFGLFGEEQLDPLDHRGNDLFTNQRLPGEASGGALDVLRGSFVDPLGGAEGTGNRHRVAVKIGDIQHERLSRILMDKAQLRDRRGCGNRDRGGSLDLESPEIDITPLGSLQRWRDAGFDRNSVIADPLFTDPSAGDFTLRPDSPAFELGFQPIPVDRIGPDGYEGGR